jgi:hypothetical protein
MHMFLYSYNVTFLYMFWALLCSSSGGQTVCIQDMVSSLSMSSRGGRAVHRLREIPLNSSGRAVWGLGMKPLGSWYCGFESRWGHGCVWCVFVVCCVGSGLCGELIPQLEESYHVCVSVCLTVCDLETSKIRRARPELGSCTTEKESSDR